MAEAPRRDIVVIGASAGGVEACSSLLSRLPHDLPAAVFIALHMGAARENLLPSVLQTRSDLPVLAAVDNAPVVPGHVLVSVPDRHLVLTARGVQLSQGPRENRSRPSIDVLFRTAAAAYGPRVVAVLLSGLLDDGVAGMTAVKQCGGTTIAQDPSEAAFPDLPAAAVQAGAAQHILKLGEIAVALLRLVESQAGPPKPLPSRVAQETNIHIEPGNSGNEATLGPSSDLSCPECGGPLRLVKDPQERFRCKVGHAFTAESLAEAQKDEVERALWTAYRVLIERARHLDRMAARFRDRSMNLAQEYSRRAEEAERNAASVQRLLTGE